MERLTDDIECCCRYYDCELHDDCKPGLNCAMADLYDRLREYEQTGLSPDDAYACKRVARGRGLPEIDSFDGVSIDRLRELAQADKEGRVVVTPCQVGDDLYFISSDGGIQKITVNLLISGPSGNRVRCYGNFKGNLFLDFDTFANSAFSTREEAAKALEERRAEDG